MKSCFRFRRSVMIAMLVASATGIQAAEFAVTTNSTLVLVSLKEAQKALTTEDDFIRALSDFDRSSRTKSETPVTRAQFLKFIEGEALAWTEADAVKMESVARNANRKLSKLKLALPGQILLVKTTGQEEGSAAYCRGTNIIVMPNWIMNAPSEKLESYLVHELFHILSRNNLELRKQLYSIIGFKPCPEIKYPTELEARRITNPDATRLDYFIEVTRNNQKQDAVPVLFATPERWNKAQGGSFFAYLTFRLMAIDHADAEVQVLSENGKPLLLELREVSGYLEQIGETSGLELQPEEIMAEYFERFVEGHDPIPSSVEDGMRRLLKR